MGFENNQVPEESQIPKTDFGMSEKFQSLEKANSENIKGLLESLKLSRNFLDEQDGDYVKLFYKNNFNTTRVKDHDNGMTGASGIEVKKGPNTCALDFSVITDKVGNSRNDELELGCNKELLSFGNEKIEIDIFLGGQVKSVNNYGGQEIQNKIHENRGMNPVIAPYGPEYVTGGLQGKIRFEYNLVDGYVDIVSEGKIKWNFDNSGYAIATIMMEGKYRRLTFFLGGRASLVKGGDNSALVNTLGDGKGKAIFIGTKIGISKRIDLNFKTTPYSPYQNGNETGIDATFKF